MNDFLHGGNLREAQDKYGISRKKIVDFSASINPLGLPFGFKRLIYNKVENIKNYPDSENKQLTGILADKLKLHPDNIIIGNGSNELIYLLLNYFFPKKVIIPVPSYSEYERASLAAGASCAFVKILGGNRTDFDLKNILSSYDKDSGLLFICNPQNPTGKLWEKEELGYLIKECQQFGILILVDEAFISFIPDEEKYSVVDLLKSYNNLIVLRSMTKIYAIPGLRLGYLLGSKEIIIKLKSKQPNWQVNSLAQDIGPYMLRNSKYLLKSKNLIPKLKDHFYQELNEFDWINPQYPSVNFIFCKLKGSITNSKKLGEYLIKKHKILIRDCSNFRGLDKSYIRLAVKSRKENLELIRCLKEFEKGL